MDLKGRIKLAQPLHIPPRPDSPGIRKFMYEIVQHTYFKRLSVVLVLSNCMLLCVPVSTSPCLYIDSGKMVEEK